MPVCLSLRMAISVPFGKEDPFVGMKVTRILSSIRFVSVFPCVAWRPSCQPSFLRRLINCGPVRDGILARFKRGVLCRREK